MNHRERFIATMHYQPRDRAPLYDFSFWDETLPEWYKQGLPITVTRANAGQFFGLDVSLGGGDGGWHVPCKVGLCPGFETIVIEDLGDQEVVQQDDGVRVLRRKDRGSIPQHQGHLLTDRETWERYYKLKLDPVHPDRLPRELEQLAKAWRDPDREHPLFLPGGSLYGWLRNWMGVENVSLLIYDEPDLFEEMVTTIADCIVGTLQPILETGGKFEACGMWEDMCYNAGPLLGPEQFRRFLLPQYKRLSGLLREYGVDVIWADCDGKIDLLIPLWLEAGVNCMFPIEVGTWRADPVELRKQYGKDLLIMGGFDKHILAGTKADIDREVRRLAPLVQEGGFIVMPDHRVPPNVPFENYLYYTQTIKKVWGNSGCDQEICRQGDYLPAKMRHQTD